MKIDFHVHTNYSIDSLIRPIDLIKKSTELAIIPAVTDHNVVGAHDFFKKHRSDFIPGEEIRTDKGDLIALYINERIPEHTSFEESIDLVHEQGGLIYLPHMYDILRKGVVPDKNLAGRIDIVESFNARCLSEDFNYKAREFAVQNNLVHAAGSDAHFLLEFGRTYTEVPDFDLENPRELMNSLKKGVLHTKKAPFFVRGITAFVKLWKTLFPCREYEKLSKAKHI